MPTGQKTANLALQGGGAHGAFAWGVLDRLLEDGRIAAEGISATSAGAMNAVVYAYGISIAGADGAREKLTEFWRAVSQAGERFNPTRAFPWEQWLFGRNMDMAPSYHLFQAMARVFSPYQLNPFDFHPIRNILEDIVDFERLQTCNKATRLYINATNVRTGKIRVFHNDEMSVDAVLASACLPDIFQAVEIDGEAYWDGGYMGNPAIFPLIYNSKSKDVIVVHINPLYREDVPTTAPDIYNRINEISFNSSLLREMRAIAFVSDLIDKGLLVDEGYSRILIHSIANDDVMTKLGVASKLNPDWDFLCRLRDAGRDSASQWLESGFENVNARSSVDLEAIYR